MKCYCILAKGPNTQLKREREGEAAWPKGKGLRIETFGGGFTFLVFG